MKSVHIEGKAKDGPVWPKMGANHAGWQVEGNEMLFDSDKLSDAIHSVISTGQSVYIAAAHPMVRGFLALIVTLPGNECSICAFQGVQIQGDARMISDTLAENVYRWDSEDG